MTVFVDDAFTDSDGVTLQNHTPTTAGGAWVKRAGLTDWHIDTNHVEPVSTDTYARYTNASAPGSVDYDITQDVTLTSGYFGNLARYVDESNYYSLYHAVGTYRIRKRVAGAWTTLETLVEAVPVVEFEWKTEIRDAAKKIIIDSVEKLSSADNALTAAGVVGMYIFDDYDVDDFVAEDAGAPAATTASMQPIRFWWAR